MDIENTLAMEGGAIKALGESTEGGRRVGKLGGVLCRFTGAEDPDRTKARDFFDANTNFKMTEGMATPVFYHHGLHPTVSVKEIGAGTLHLTADGVEIKSELWLDDADGARFYREASAGKLAWSSGTANHLVKRTPIATKSGETSHHIDHWPLGLDASLTPSAAEPRNVAVALKCLMDEMTVEEHEGAVEPPPAADATKSLEILEAGQQYGSRIVDHIQRFVNSAEEVTNRMSGLSAHAVKAGRVLSEENCGRLKTLRTALGDVLTDLDGLLDKHAPEAKPDEAVAGKSLDMELIDLEVKTMMQNAKLGELLQGIEL